MFLVPVFFQKVSLRQARIILQLQDNNHKPIAEIACIYVPSKGVEPFWVVLGTKPGTPVEEQAFDLRDSIDWQFASPAIQDAIDEFDVVNGIM